jgi:hypothetical protein
VYKNTLSPEVGLHLPNYSTEKPPANFHFRNNLILGQGGYNEIFFLDTCTNYSSSDYNGFRPNEGEGPQFVWSSPSFETLADYSRPREIQKFKTLSEYSRATGQDRNSILIDWDVFVKVPRPVANDPQRLYRPEELDFGLRPGATAIDAGCTLPNISDGFSGKAPDIGALEFGQLVPH